MAKLWSEPRYIEHDVFGETLRFYELPAIMAPKAKKISLAAISSVMALSRTPREDAGIKKTEDVERTELAVDETGTRQMASFPGRKTSVEHTALTLDVITYHDQRRNNAAEALISTLLDPKTFSDIVEMVLSCLRDEYPKPPTPQDVAEAVREITLPTLVELVKGMLKANTMVFGSFSGVIQKALSRAKDHLDKAVAEEDEETEPK